MSIKRFFPRRPPKPLFPARPDLTGWRRAAWDLLMGYKAFLMVHGPLLLFALLLGILTKSI